MNHLIELALERNKRTWSPPRHDLTVRQYRIVQKSLFDIWRQCWCLSVRPRLQSCQGEEACRRDEAVVFRAFPTSFFHEWYQVHFLLQFGSPAWAEKTKGVLLSLSFAL